MSSENIYTHSNFVDNKYQRLYFKIINNAKSRSEISGYTEIHHIIPRSMNGDNSQENLVVLTAREHFICHYLLVKFTKDEGNKSMVYAFYMMKPSNKNKNRYINSRLYDSLRVEFSRTNSKLHKGKKVSDETRQKQSESLKNSGKVAGKNNGMYGKTHTKEARQIFSQTASKTFKGKSYNELYGEEKSKELKETKSKSVKNFIQNNPGCRSGKMNGNAKTYLLTSPENIEYIVSGSLKEFCKQHNLNITTLRYAMYKNKIPYGVNIGWKIIEI